jgi:hypothetical protein
MTAAKNLDHAIEFQIAADDGFKLAIHRGLGEILE